jgi:hypothetical protein
VPLRIPVYAVPKPVADITASDRVRFTEGDSRAVLDLSGRGVDQGSGDEAYRSVVSVLQLGTESPRLPECDDERVVDCTPNETAEGGDLRYVGAASTAPLVRVQGRPQDAVLAFGVATWGNWYNIGSNTIPFVDMDTTGDGVPDFETYVTKPDGSDVLLAVTTDLRAEGFPVVDAQPVNGQFGDVDTNVFDTNVIVLPVTLSALGIDPAAESAPITYTTGMSGFYTGPGDTDGVIDIADPVLFDALTPGLDAQGGGDPALSYLARPGTALVVNRDAAAATAQRAEDLLVIHHHNASEGRAQVVDAGAPLQLPLPQLPVPPVPVPPAPAAPPTLPAEPAPAG